jgi:DNA-directed RNA polymerase subunit RPC12/RpoP
MLVPAPGRCADCGNDAYIHLANESGMLCAHCYGKRLGVGMTSGRKGGELDKRRGPGAAPR